MILLTTGAPPSVQVDAGEDEARSFFFRSEDAMTCDKLLILIHGSGAVRAGQWARRYVHTHTHTHTRTIHTHTHNIYIHTCTDWYHKTLHKRKYQSLAKCILLKVILILKTSVGKAYFGTSLIRKDMYCWILSTWDN